MGMNITRRICALGATAALVAVGIVPAAAAAPGNAPGRVDVIVQFDDEARGVRDAEAVARAHGVELGFVYEHAFNGFSGSVTQGRMAALGNDPRIASVSLDVEATIAAQTVPTGVRRIHAADNGKIPTDSAGPAGQVDADVAVLDTGIDTSHPDLDVEVAVDCTSSHSGGRPGTRTYSCVDGGTDGHGHGTHVAGTIAALNNDVGVVGVAPGARLWSVKVLDDRGSGSVGTVLAGLDYVAAANASGIVVEVANMSIGFSVTVAEVDDAIDAVSTSGTAVVVAAGNDGVPAEDSTPSSADSAIVVAALADFDGAAGGLADSKCRSDVGGDDEWATFSNYGAAVDLIAPGVCIRSTYPGGGTATMSGTSMAAPHVAGAAAVLASSGIVGGPSILTALTGAATDEWSWSTSPDATDAPPSYPLLDVHDDVVFKPSLAGAGDPGGGDANVPPTASFSFSCTDLACAFDGTGSSDSDGSIASYDWDFGDGSTGSGVKASHTFGSGGTYTVTLTVTDDVGDIGMATQDVIVTAGGGGVEDPAVGISLTANGYKVKGVHNVDLSWSGEIPTENVVIFRGGSVVATTANDGAYTDDTGNRGGVTYTYKVCEEGTNTCSNEATVTF